MCKYNFVVDQQYFDGDAQQNITISAKIGISCHSGKLLRLAAWLTLLL